MADLIAMATVWPLRLQKFICIQRKIDISGRHGLDFSLDNCEIAAIMRTNGECVLSMKIPNRWWMKGTMKKRNLYLVCACIGLMLLTACTSGGETSADSSAAEGNMEDHTAGTDEIPLENEQEETAPEQDYEYPSEDAGSVREESRLGYAMTYDPTVFTLDDTGEDQDIYTYHTSETLDGPVYIAIQSYPDMDAKTLADGIALQSGQDGVAAQETYFGADSLDTQCVYYEEDVNGVTQVHTFYAVPKGEGALLVEVTGYVNLPLQIQGKLEEMTGTFELL